MKVPDRLAAAAAGSAGTARRSRARLAAAPGHASALAIVLLATALLAGCEVGPDFLRPAAPRDAGYTPKPLPAETESSAVQGGSAQRFVAREDIPGQWWTLFHSAPLNQLIDRALRANPTIDAAEAALRQARENVVAGQGALFPSAGVTGSAERTQLSGATFGEPGLSEVLNLYNASVNVSYALDVFGGTRRQIEALKAQAEYQRFQLEAVYLSLTANVVTAAVSEASLHAQIGATQDIIKIETDQLDVVRHQFELGGTSKTDVLTQEATLAQAQATLPPLEKQLAQTRDQLMAYSGRFPNQDDGQAIQLASLHLPQDLPVSVPSKLIEQRPDVRASEALLHEASAEIGVAVANQLPQFAISGNVGTVALTLSDVAAPGSFVWTFAGSAAQTVFDAGTLEHKKRAAVAAFDQAAATYRNSVLTAVQNVADTLRALEADARALKAQVAAERSASDSLTLARVQYKAGGIPYLTLLNAERTYQETRISLVQAQAARFADTAALFQALGGGWWNRTDVPPNTIGRRTIEDWLIP